MIGDILSEYPVETITKLLLTSLKLFFKLLPAKVLYKSLYINCRVVESPLDRGRHSCRRIANLDRLSC